MSLTMFSGEIGPRPLRWDRAALMVVALTAVGAITVGMAGWQGSDYPAQIYRVELFRQAGFTLWDRGWYGGHYTLGYSVLFPPLASWIGITTLAVISTIGSTVLFFSLIRQTFARASAPAALWFGTAMIVNLLVGRLTFGLGVMFGLAALVALRRDRSFLAIGFALATGLTSPVAGVLLTLAAAASATEEALSGPGRWTSRLFAVRSVTAVIASAPVVAVAMMFPSPGVFPFRGGHFVGVVLTGTGLAIVLPKHLRAMRIAAAWAAIVAVPLFLIANPLGGNLIRLPTIFAWPILAGALWNQRRWLVLLAAVPLAVWLTFPAVLAADSYNDPSSNAEFYEPLTDYIEQAPGAVGRLEIPFTAGHWEAAYVAPTIPLARGWERQIDMASNGLFYDDTLNPVSYRQWMLDNAVRWVAVPDAEFDHGGAAEVALLETTKLPWLKEVWSNPDWVLYEVVDAAPLVSAPGRLLHSDPNGIDIAIDGPGTVLVRESYTPYWTTDGSEVCVTESDDGQTMIKAAEAGVVTLRAEFSLSSVAAGESTC